MSSLPQDWQGLCLLIFALGFKHGFDADHLAAIDGLARVSQWRNPRLARYCGTLFSLGHGMVVLLIALLVGTLAQRWEVPRWLDAFGAWISIGFLTALGVVNVRAVLVAPPQQVVRPVGVKGRLLGRLGQAASPAGVAMVGALFALSFDTLSQTALFALAAAQTGGWRHVAVLGLLFMAGMVLTDGINGLWIARLIRRADQLARIASRVMGLAVGGASLLVAAFTLARLGWPALDAWTEGRELGLGAALIALVASSFLVARRLAPAPRAAPQRA
jgi:high-affinity nickel-transport protein